MRKSSPGSLGVPKLSRMMTRPEPNYLSPTRLSLDRSRKVPTTPEVSLSMMCHLLKYLYIIQKAFS